MLPLHEKAKAAAGRIGKVTDHLGHNACKIPFAPEYIKKMEDRDLIGKKRKTVKC